MSSCLLMLQVIATNETSTTVTPSSTATANATKVFSYYGPLLCSHSSTAAHDTAAHESTMLAPCIQAQFCTDKAVVIANTWQPLGASRQLTLAAQCGCSLLYSLKLSLCNNNRYDCARRSSRISTLPVWHTRRIQVRPLMQQFKPRLWLSGPIVVRGTCGEPHIHPQGNGLLLVTPRNPYISAIYIPWIRRSFRVKALTRPARPEDLMATA